MAMRPGTVPPRSLRAAQPAPAATSLTPALLLSFQAFDAAVRLGSFKAAADALHLTPSAISHRIRNLERIVGTGLFSRVHRAVRPTAAGVALAGATGRAFAELARAAAPAQRGTQRRLRLASMPLFASAWLIPHIAGFTSAHPDIELAIDSSTRPVDFDCEAYDAAICVGDGTFGRLAAAHLMDIGSTPVATAAMVRRLKLDRPEDLIRAPLIHVTAFPLAWPAWFAEAGLDDLRGEQAIWVDGFGAALEAARRGAGVALGLEPLFAESERCGALCRPFAIRHPTGGYWLVHRPSDHGHRALRVFKRWLLAELAADR